jgi:hypothetical protein
MTARTMTGYRMFFVKKKFAEEEEIVVHKAWLPWLPSNSVRKNIEAPQH